MKVLMVCLGNICRSPLAQGILEKKIAEKNLNWQVDSAGTSNYHIGNPADERSISTANTHGIDISDQKARQFVESDFENFDLIYAMDQSNYQNILKLASSSKDKQKVELILNEAFPMENSPVPDPYYGGINGFENVYQLLDSACEKIIEKYHS